MISKTLSPEAVNNLLVSLPPEEQARVVEYGAMLRLTDLKSQLARAQSVIKELSEKYHTTLAELEREGLPEDAGWEMHEDYIMWHHYSERAARIEKYVAALEKALASENLAVSNAS